MKRRRTKRDTKRTSRHTSSSPASEAQRGRGTARSAVEGAGRTDWARVAKLSDAGIERMAARDADNPATVADDWANAFIGAPPLKEPVNAKFDADVVAWFKSQGRGYQARMNAVLRRYMEVHRKVG